MSKWTVKRRLVTGAAVLVAGFGAMNCASAATVTRSLCIYDPIGANGFIYQTFQRYVVEALNWGVKFEPKPYTDETVAMADFSAGKCDAVEIPGIDNIHLEKFAGSLDMLGGLQTYAEEHTAIEVISSPKAAPLMTQGDVEVVGVAPGGKAFLFARNRENLASISKAAGKKVAILNNDKQATTFANVAGASAVNATIATFGPMFNNGSVDYCYAPSFAYKALELYKGLQHNGGIADYVLGQLSLQLDIHKNKFPAAFGQASRTWVAQNLWSTAIAKVKESDAGIPKKYWVHISGDRTKKYNNLAAQVRQRLWDDGWYAHKMQRLLKKIRCQGDPSMAECSASTEGGPV
ncbi:MAG TPA: putative solute-binding protein [Nevskiaceae bacterium]|nr:putative solute-binding protein [Nevskiaceae bacterium]